ncbi:MAG: DUF1223 domain-containing protein [Betaproteobacteria bacterium]|nr:DUF1223 domain-containing protein [Betaproteobacteria bacterium]
MNKISIVSLGLVAIALAMPADAQQCLAKSPGHTLALVELYTSEGCDSCPPADKWLRSIASTRGVQGVVPLALHVDYWDYIGWKDPFARPQFASRQRELSAVQGRTFVYTPQVVFGGRDYRRWGSSGEFLDDVKKTNAQPARADIEISIMTLPGGRIEARAETKIPDARHRADTVLYLAIYQNGLSTAVAAGENRGKTLAHDFVARAWAEPVVLGATGAGRAALGAQIPSASSANAGVAAFVQNRRSGDVLQAFSMSLCSSH